MANVNRYVGEKDGQNTVLISVGSGVTVEMGDLMFIDNSDDLRNNGDSEASYAGYPFEYLRISGSSLTLNKAEVKNRFLGVALDDKDGIDGGVSQNITVATRGKFNFDLSPPKSVRVGNLFGASGTTAASDLYNQKVMIVSETNFALGKIAETKTYAQNADMFIETIFHPNSG